MLISKSALLGRTNVLSVRNKTQTIRLLSSRPKNEEAFFVSKKQRKALRLVEETPTSEDSLFGTMEIMKEDVLMQDMEHEELNPLPWNSLLGYPSRALWRSSPKPPPPYLLETQSNIIRASQRTSKQLRRTYDNIILKHKVISEKRERERRRRVNGPGHAATSLSAKKQNSIDKSSDPVYYKPEYAVSSLKYRLVPNYSIMKRILAETQGLLGKDVFQPKKVLDVGIGAGSSSAAALEYFNEQQTGGIEWIHGIDPSQSMRDASSILLSKILEGQSFSKSSRVNARLTFGDSILSSSDTSDVRSGGSFDLAICAYTLFEVPSVAASLTMAALVWEKLSPGGVAIFIEPGTPDGFNALRSVRSMLLDCCPPNEEEKFEGEEECHVIAPCTHNGSCPMVRHQKFFFKNRDDNEFGEEENAADDVEMEIEEEDEGDEEDEIDLNGESNEHDRFSASETDVFNTAFCSFVHAMPGKTRQGEKFSYLVVQKRISYPMGDGDAYDVNNPFKNTNIVDLLKESLDAGSRSNHSGSDSDSSDRQLSLLQTAREIEGRYLDSESDKLGLELVRGKNRKSWGRIVRAPIKKKGHVILDYCSCTKNENDEEVGRIVRSKVTRSQSTKGAPGIYLSSRKSRWGGLWPDVTSSKDD